MRKSVFDLGIKPKRWMAIFGLAGFLGLFYFQNQNPRMFLFFLFFSFFSCIWQTKLENITRDEKYYISNINAIRQSSRVGFAILFIYLLMGTRYVPDNETAYAVLVALITLIFSIVVIASSYLTYKNSCN